MQLLLRERYNSSKDHIHSHLLCTVCWEFNYHAIFGDHNQPFFLTGRHSINYLLRDNHSGYYKIIRKNYEEGRFSTNNQPLFA